MKMEQHKQLIQIKTWKFHSNHILINNIYDGEFQYENLNIKNWNNNDSNDKKWFECNDVIEPFQEKLVPKFSLPVIVIIKTPSGEIIIDMG